MKLRYPRALDIVSSGLVLDACHRRPADFTTVMLVRVGLSGCPRNALIAVGSARGEIRLAPETIGERATVSLLAGPFRADALDLVALVEGQNPFGGLTLAYRGSITPARPPFGGTLTIELPAIPEPPNDAVIALREVDITIGDDSIVYTTRRNGRTRRYRPGGPLTPRRCGAETLPFEAEVSFADATSARTATTAACP